MTHDDEKDLSTIDQVLAQVAAAPEIEPALRLREGETIGERYVVESELGSGGMGRVYLARDTELGRQVAIKLLTGFASEGALERLLEEARTMAALSHPNVVTIHEVGRVSGQMFLAMEHMPGGSLRSYLEEHDAEEITERFIEAGRGLAAAHREGIVHRDFKPDNVLLSRDSRACVADFGLARPATPAAAKTGAVEGSNSPQTTSSRDSAGTPAYMAPEQIEGEGVDARSDQFSFCVALWEGLTGELPFRGKSRELSSAPPSRLPAPIRHILRRGLSVDPDERFGTMDELLSELEPRRSDPVKAIIIVATIAFTLAAAALIYFGRKDNEVLCSQEEDLAAALWSEEQQAAVRAAFTNTRLSYALDLYERIAIDVPLRLADLSERRAEACRAAKVNGFMSDATYERALLCLGDQRRQMRAQITRWASADNAVVVKGVEALRQLPRAANCLDAQHLAASAPVPDASIAADVTALRDRLAVLNADRQSGQLEEAELESKKLVAEARTIGFAPLLAEALYQRGVVARSRGKTDEAQESLREAYVTATEAESELLAARATRELAYVLAIAGGDAEAAELWRDLLEVAAKKATGGPRFEFEALDALGAIADFQGDYKSALSHRRRAFAIAEEHYKDEPLILARAEANLGLTWHALGKLTDAASSYERALAMIETAVGPGHPSRALLLDNAGLANAGLGNTEKAVQQLESALVIEADVYGAEAIEVGFTTLNLGVAYANDKQYKRAIGHYEKALVIVKNRLGEKHPDVALVQNSLGVAYEGLGQFDEAASWLQKALAIIRAQDEHHPNVALFIANIGEVQRKGGRYREAIGSFNDAIKRWEKAGDDGPNLVKPLTGAGETLIELGRKREAIAHLERAEKLAPKDPAEQVARIAKALKRARAK